MAGYITPSLNMRFSIWAKKMIPILNLIDILVPESDDEWRKWGLKLRILYPSLQIPNPTENIYPGKEGWVKWANQLILNLNL